MGTTRTLKTENEFFDLLSKITNNTYISIGYVTGANLNVPKVKRKNPATGRQIGYPDYTSFKNENYPQEIGALVKISSYNFRYYSRDQVAKQYSQYKKKANVIRAKYGLEPIKDRDPYKGKTGWSDRAPEVYKGNNQDLVSNSYTPQNVFGAKVKGVTYAVGTDGHIIRAFSDEEIKSYLQAKKEMDGVAALRKMGVEQRIIEEYIKEMTSLKFKYRNFESKSILWMCATTEDHEKFVYINNQITRIVDGINIIPEDFIKIAEDRYKKCLKDLQTMANNVTENKHYKNRLMHLTESNLKRIIAESINETLNEYGETEKGQRELGLLFARKYYNTPEGDDEYQKFYDYAAKHNDGKRPSEHFFKGRNDRTEYEAAKQNLSSEKGDGKYVYGREELGPFASKLRQFVRKSLMDLNTRRLKR